MPICQSIKTKLPLLNGFLPPAPLDRDGDPHPAHRGKHHLPPSLLGGRVKSTVSLSTIQLCFEEENAPLNLSVSTAKTQQFILSNRHDVVNKSDPFQIVKLLFCPFKRHQIYIKV